MQSKLAAKDLELAKTQQNLALLQNEVVELRRFHQRDGINMDYLKNIVIQVGIVFMFFNFVFLYHWQCLLFYLFVLLSVANNLRGLLV